MKLNGFVVLGFGIIVMFGGLIGYLTANSLISLFAGTISGAVLVAGGMGLIRNSVIAYYVSLVATGLLTLFFAYRYVGSYKMMPSGMMGILSLVVFVLLLSTRKR